MAKFKFIDLFSGIGGFHLGLHQAGGSCILASDIDEQANQTYAENFGIVPKGDVRKIVANQIPDFDVLCAGFPCQSFSNVGPKGGLNDPRGALFYEIGRILRVKRPKTFILENVKGLFNHDGGDTFKIILDILDSAGYFVSYEILEAKDYGLPQIRKRLFIVGVQKRFRRKFQFPKKKEALDFTLSDVLKGKVERDYAFTIRIGGRRSGINNRYNWDSYKVDGEVRYITPEECKLLQGFPTSFKLTGRQSAQYKQVGNSVPVNLVNAIAQALIDQNFLP